MNRVHFAGYRCGRGKGKSTQAIGNVTCLICVRRLWRDVAVAHYRAYGASAKTEHGKRIRNAMRDTESAIRGRTTR